MKTQIKTLVHGTTHNITGVSGTTFEIRKEISEKVIAENPEKMTIELNGQEIELTANWSLSGKSVNYHGEISVDTYKIYCGDHGLPKKSPKAYIHISNDMHPTLTTNSRKQFYKKIDASNITIK